MEPKICVRFSNIQTLQKLTKQCTLSDGVWKRWKWRVTSHDQARQGKIVACETVRRDKEVDLDRLFNEIASKEEHINLLINDGWHSGAKSRAGPGRSIESEGEALVQGILRAMKRDLQQKMSPLSTSLSSSRD
jgi:hypothetical protein